MRPSASDSTPISSLLWALNSPASKLPRLTSSATLASWVTGLMTMKCRLAFRSTNEITKMSVRASMKLLNVSFARWIGTDIGTDTTCAPMTSFIFQPKPLAVPYRSTIVRGADSAVVWHARHAALVIWIGRAR